MRDRLIVALDLAAPEAAEAMVARLGSAVSFYKIGYQLALAGGLELARDLVRDGRGVFLDMKLLDIDNTVARGVESAAAIGVSMLTVHAYPKAMRAAAAAASGTNLTVLGVTALTSMDDADLADAGYRLGAAGLVALRAGQAREAGIGGIVCAAAEVPLVRPLLDPSMAVVTPGIRPAGAEHGDQKRVAAPGEALRAGATHLVVGRPITGAPDPAAAASAILKEMQSAGVRSRKEQD